MSAPARLRALALALALALAVALAAPLPLAAQEGGNDYPTVDRAEYVFACMATNGQTRSALERCACSIDAIAAILPFADYVAGETVLRMRQTTGERSSLFRTPGLMTDKVAVLRRAQAEAEILCF